MIYKIGDSVISPLGYSTDQNYLSVVRGLSALTSFDEGDHGVPFPHMASVIDPLVLEEFASGFGGARTHARSRLYKLAISAIGAAINNSVAPFYRSKLLHNKRVMFIMCTTKGNINLLPNASHYAFNNRLFSWQVAQSIMEELNISGKPVVLLDSAVSGALAQLMAFRALDCSKRYDYAIVVGAEIFNAFSLCSFASLGILSPQPCRPFDAQRAGTNIGEAAACAIYASEETYAHDMPFLTKPASVSFRAGHVAVDSSLKGFAPSKQGLSKAISMLLQNVSAKDVEFVNTLGMGTVEGDDMESLAIEQAGLGKVPVFSLRAHFGYCSSVTSLMDSIISCRAFEDHVILPTLGFQKSGVTGKIIVRPAERGTHTGRHKPYFMSLAYGVGGVHTALLFSNI